MDRLFQEYNEFIIENKKIPEDRIYVEYLSVINDLFSESLVAMNNIEVDYIERFTDSVNFWRFLIYKKTIMLNKMIEVNRDLIVNLRRFVK